MVEENFKYVFFFLFGWVLVPVGITLFLTFHGPEWFASIGTGVMFLIYGLVNIKKWKRKDNE